MQMPVMDGLSATRAIREIEIAEGRASTPVLMVTANCMPQHEEASRLSGADGQVGKPINPAELFAALAEALSPERTGSGARRAPRLSI